jgi:hypothetical protein
VVELRQRKSSPEKQNMPSVNGRSRRAADETTPATVDELARRLRPLLSPIDARFSWHAMSPLAEEDQKQYLTDPVAALPPTVRSLLPRVGIVLAPYLERSAPKSPVSVVYKKPAEARLVLSTRVLSEKPSGKPSGKNAGRENDFAMLFFTIKDEQVADYHYFFYDELAALLSQTWPDSVQEIWHRLLREELSAEVHGEVDERSWHLKQALLRRPMAARKDGKPFRDYARESFRDTLTLFLHGICCDIDVETGPRQIPSRYLRKRLEQLKKLFPPPEDHAVFPEDLTRR